MYRGYPGGFYGYLSGGGVTLSALPPRVGSSGQADVDFPIYTDASYEVEWDTGGLGAVVIDRLNFISSANHVDTIYESIASKASIGRFRHSSIIFGLEMTAVCWAVFAMGEWLRGKNPLILSITTPSFARAASTVGAADRFAASICWH